MTARKIGTDKDKDSIIKADKKRTTGRIVSVEAAAASKRRSVSLKRQQQPDRQSRWFPDEGGPWPRAEKRLPALARALEGRVLTSEKDKSVPQEDQYASRRLRSQRDNGTSRDVALDGTDGSTTSDVGS